MQKRLVTRYTMKSPGAADENQRRVEAVFGELVADQPHNVSYIVLRLADDSFVHVSYHDHGDDEDNPISSTVAFAYFQDGHGDRRAGGVDPPWWVRTSPRSADSEVFAGSGGWAEGRPKLSIGIGAAGTVGARRG